MPSCEASRKNFTCARTMYFVEEAAEYEKDKLQRNRSSPKYRQNRNYTVTTQCYRSAVILFVPSPPPREPQ
mgnify:CR=1 FL=1